MEPTFVGLILFLAIVLLLQMRKIEARLSGRTSTEAISSAIIKHREDLQSTIDQLEARIQPVRTLVDGSGYIDNWEHSLKLSAEGLRPLISSDASELSFEFGVAAAEMPMNFNYAHALCCLDIAQAECVILKRRWLMHKTNILAAHHSRGMNFIEIAEREFGLREIEERLKRFEGEAETWRRAALDAIAAHQRVQFEGRRPDQPA